MSGGDIEQRLREADADGDDLDAKQWRASVAQKLFGKAKPEIRIGRHRVISRIGEGASGVVYLALDPELDRRVAVKVLRREALSFSQDPQAWLAREAKTLAQLSHPNVVPVYDVGKHDGKVFITLEFVEGSNLRQWLSQTHGVDEIVDVLGQAARGLAAAHGAGVVHRDFKPENVLLGADGRVRVSDFGIARRLDATQQEATLPEGAEAVPAHFAGETTTYRTAGTPAYMAPEQFLGDPVDARTDQFAFCVVLHEALYGRRPFLGGDRAKLAANVIAGRRIIPPGAEPAPRWLERVVARGLSVRPDDRYPSMEALLAELGRDRRRRGWPVAAALVAGVGATSAALLLSPPEAPDACAGGHEKIETIWNDNDAALVRVAFVETGLPYAEDSWERVDHEVRRYGDLWVNAHQQACAGAATQDVVVERLHCLQSRMLELGSLTELYARADTQVVDHAVRAVGSLRKPSECLLVQPTGLGGAEPEADKAEIRLAVAQAKAAGDLGRPRDGADQAWAAARTAQKLGDRALEAEALIVAGEFELMRLAEPRPPRPDTTTYASVLAAEAARRPDLLARAHVAYLAALAAIGQYDRAFEWMPQARGAVEAMGSPPELVGQLEYNLALIYDSLGDVPNGEAATARARAALEGGGPSTRRWLAQTVNITGEWRFYAKDYDAALNEYKHALALAVQELGPRHAWASNGHGNMAEVYFVTGDYNKARRHFEAALSIRREAFGNETVWVPHTLAHLGDVKRAQGDIDGAIAAYEEALQLRSGLGLMERGGVRPAVYDDLQVSLQEPWLRRGMALALVERRDFDAALDYAQQVTAAELPADRQHCDLTGRVDVEGQVLLAMGEHEDAAAQLEGALARMEAHYGDDHRFLAWPLTALGRARLALGDDEGAKALLRRALSIREATPEANLRSRADAEMALAEIIARAAAGADAQRLAAAAVVHYDAAANASDDQRAAARALAARL